MKKVFGFILTLIMVVAVSVASYADKTVSFSTIQQALEEAEDTGIEFSDTGSVGHVVLVGDTYYRVVAMLDKTVDKMIDDFSVLEEKDEEAFEESLNEYIYNLPAIVEEITAVPADLSELIGKTLGELGAYRVEWELGELLNAPAMNPAIWRVVCDMFTYDITIDATHGKFEGFLYHFGDDVLANFVVKDITYAGLSYHAADIHYAADGSFVPESDDEAFINSLKDVLSKEGIGDKEIDGLFNLLSDLSEEEYEDVLNNIEDLDTNSLLNYLQTLNKDGRQPGQPEPPPAKPQK